MGTCLTLWSGGLGSDESVGNVCRMRMYWRSETRSGKGRRGIWREEENREEEKRGEEGKEEMQRRRRGKKMKKFIGRSR